MRLWDSGPGDLEPTMWVASQEPHCATFLCSQAGRRRLRLRRWWRRGAAAPQSGESPEGHPKSQACPDACQAVLGPLEEPSPGLGTGMLQVGQMGQGCPWCPILRWLRPAPCFAGAERQTGQPSCCCSSCSRCSIADQKMQNLVLSALPDDVANPGPDFWDMAWRDLAELVERGSLPCCSSPRAQSVERQRASAAQSGESSVGQPQIPCLP